MNKRIKNALRNVAPIYLVTVGLNIALNGFGWYSAQDSINYIDKKMASGEAGFELGESRHQDFMSTRQVWEKSLEHARSGTIGPRVLIPGDFIYTFAKNSRDLSDPV